MATDTFPGDKAAILYGYKQLRKVVTDPALSPVLLKEVYPGANVTSDEDLWKAIQKASLTFHHPVRIQSCHFLRSFANIRSSVLWPWAQSLKARHGASKAYRAFVLLIVRRFPVRRRATPCIPCMRMLIMQHS